MAARHPDAPRTASDEEPTGYRSVSRLAIAACMLGIVSGLAVVSPFFLVVPLVAVAVAVAAFADIDRPGAAKAGRLAALAGLALAIGFGTQAAVAGIAERVIASRRAAAAAEIFLDAVRGGRVADAESMCGQESRGAVARLASCVGAGTCGSARAGDEAGTWVVQIELGGCVARLVLAPTVVTQRGKPIERWIVTACEVSDVAVRPSGS